MARKNARFHADGVMVVDKPAGITSFKALEVVKRKLAPLRIGHTGTLDPFAEGVLVLLFNQATRLADLFGQGRKVYHALLTLGQKRDTGDHTGQMVAEACVPELTDGQVSAAMQSLVGRIMQAPPMYSAAKFEGKALYRYAREGIKIAKPPREVDISSACLLDLQAGRISFELVCGSGVYVRSWAEDLAAGLGTLGYLSSLSRERNGPFSRQEALSLDEAMELDEESLREKVMPCNEALDALGVPELKVNNELGFNLRQGLKLERRLLSGAPVKGPAYMIDEDGDIVSVVRFLDMAPAGRDYETIRVFNKSQTSASGN